MNLLLFDESEYVDTGVVRITGRRLQHLREVHGASVGDSLRAGQVGGRIGTGTISQLSLQAATLRISLTAEPPAKLPVTLVVALPRPKMLRRILRSIAEFGVRDIIIVNSNRVEKSYWQTPVLEPSALRHYLMLGLEQSGDTVFPGVHLQRRFKPWVEDELPALARDRRALFCHPGSRAPCPAAIATETLMIVGPEGGFIPYEVEKLEHAGCTGVHLGQRILRVENAVTCVLGRFAAG